MTYTAGDVYAAQRELGQERSAEWAAYIEWRQLSRDEDLELGYEAWLDTVPASQLPALIISVNAALEADDTGKASPPSLAVAD